MFDNQSGEIRERRLRHREEAEEFCRGLAGDPVLVGMEACGHYPWFERLLEELGFELWLGDAAKVRASVVRKQRRTGWTRSICRGRVPLFDASLGDGWLYDSFWDVELPDHEPPKTATRSTWRSVSH